MCALMPRPISIATLTLLASSFDLEGPSFLCSLLSVYVLFFPNDSCPPSVWPCVKSIHTHTHTHTDRHRDTLSHAHLDSLSVCVSISHTHTHTHTHFLSLQHTHTHAPPPSLPRPSRVLRCTARLAHRPSQTSSGSWLREI